MENQLLELPSVSQRLRKIAEGLKNNGLNLLVEVEAVKGLNDIADELEPKTAPEPEPELKAEEVLEKLKQQSETPAIDVTTDKSGIEKLKKGAEKG
jgi:hypothetical protein